METSIDDICFIKAYNERNFIGYADSLVSYDKAIDGAVKLTDNLPIFLDTNVLLRVYEISLASRVDLLKFLEKIRVKAVITLQVQREFIKNRQHIIDTFRDTTYPGINVKFLSEVENRISDYFKANKKYLDDLPEFKKKLDSVISEVEATKSILKEELARAGEQLLITNEDDPLMKIMRGMEMVSMLTDPEILLLKSKFDILRNAIPPNEKGQQKKTINRALYAFPGAGDIDDKELDPYGDYIIFHEMVRFVKNKKTNVLFLTYDTEKGDWMDKDKKPFSHYIQVVHSITGHNIFFINAERFFEDYLDESFTSLVPDEKKGLDVSQESRILFVVKFMKLEDCPESTALKTHCLLEEWLLNCRIILITVTQLLTSYNYWKG